MLTATIIAVASAITALRLITYNRAGARYRRPVSIVAYILIVCSGAQAIDVFFNHAQPSVWHAGISVAMMVLVLRVKGNVSCFVDGKKHA